MGYGIKWNQTAIDSAACICTNSSVQDQFTFICCLVCRADPCQLIKEEVIQHCSWICSYILALFYNGCVGP